MKTRMLIFGLAFLALATPLALADEGMWLYNAFPKDRVQKQYGFLRDAGMAGPPPAVVGAL